MEIILGKKKKQWRNFIIFVHQINVMWFNNAGKNKQEISYLIKETIPENQPKDSWKQKV